MKRLSHDSKIFWLTHAILLFFLANPNLVQEDIFLILMGIIVLIGIPHGAFDPLLAMKSVNLSKFELLVYLVAYLILAVLCFVIWPFVPVLSLVTFLIISAYHFGGDWEQESLGQRFLLGLGVICLPAFFHTSMTESLFLSLTYQHSSLKFFSSVSPIIVLLFTLLNAYRLYLGKWSSLECFALLLSSYFLEPLVFFTVYFCCLHSMRHYYSCAHILSHSRRNIIAFLILALSTFALLWGGYVILQSSEVVPVQESLYRTIFIGLFALTVPHMLSVEWLTLRYNRS